MSSPTKPPRKADAKLHRSFAAALSGAWRSVAREEQIAPPGDWTHWVFCGGRGSGKTRAGAEWVLERVAAGSRRVHLIAPTVGAVRDVMLEGESGLLTVAPQHLRPVYSPSLRKLVWPNGAIGLLFSADEPDRLRGPACSTAWIDELCAMRTAEAVLDMANFGLRVGKDTRMLVTTTPRPLKVFRKLLASPATVVTRGSSYRNKAHLSPQFLREILGRYEGTRLFRQEVLGEMLTDSPGALWSLERIEELRVAVAPPFERVVVAVDPAVSFGPDADETGIIVVGLGRDGHSYVIDDLSGRFPPEEWARLAIRAYRVHAADRIVAEINQGGTLVETTLRAVDSAVPFTAVHASRGKMARAEPASALYEQGKVHHVGIFGPLEDQLTSYDGSRSGPSPDRLDALVWAIFDLVLGEPPGGFIREAALLPPRRADDVAPAAIEIPRFMSGVFASAAAGVGSEPDSMAVVYFGVSLYTSAPTVCVLDWTLEQIDSENLQRWVPGALARLDELVATAPDLRGASAGLLLEPTGIGEVVFERHSDQPIFLLDDARIGAMTFAQRAIAASGYTNARQVQVARIAHEKLNNHKGAIRNHLLHQLVAFGVDQRPEQAGPLLVAFANGVLEVFRSDHVKGRRRPA